MKFIHDSVNSKEKLIIQTDTSCNNPLRNFEMRNNLSFENRSGSVIKLNVFQKIKSCRCCNCYLLLRQEPWICSCQKQSQEIFSLTFYRHLCLTSNFFFMFYSLSFYSSALVLRLKCKLKWISKKFIQCLIDVKNSTNSKINRNKKITWIRILWISNEINKNIDSFRL